MASDDLRRPVIDELLYSYVYVTVHKYKVDVCQGRDFVLKMFSRDPRVQLANL